MKISEHLAGTWQTISLMKQQGVFGTLHEPLTSRQKDFWNMVAAECGSAERGEDVKAAIFEIPACRLLHDCA